MQQCPKCPLPGPGAGSPSGDAAADSMSQQQGQKNQVFLISQISLPCFKAEGYLGLISCNISSHVGIITTFNSGFNRFLTDIDIYIVHRNKMLFEMEKTPMPFNS